MYLITFADDVTFLCCGDVCSLLLLTVNVSKILLKVNAASLEAFDCGQNEKQVLELCSKPPPALLKDICIK